ncbi:MAG: peptidylprolyl isomerase [Myxococcota bacterium]
MTFAKTGRPNSRQTQIFINYSDRNKSLDRLGFAPFGQVVEGMDVVDSLESKYGEQPGRHQKKITQLGDEFLDLNFPDLDYIMTARVIAAE